MHVQIGSMTLNPKHPQYKELLLWHINNINKCSTYVPNSQSNAEGRKEKE